MKNWGDVENNGTISGNLMKLHEGNVDIACSGYGLTANRLIAFDSSISYQYESLTWCTPYKLLIDDWIIATSVLKFQTFLGLLCVFLIITLAVWLASVYIEKNEKEFYKKLSNCFISTLPIIMGISSKQIPKSVKIRFLILLLLFFSFNLNTAFQTYLTGILSTIKSTQKYNNLYDVYEDNLKTYSLPTFIRYFQEDDDNDLVQLIRKNWNICYHAKDCLKEMIQYKDRACSIPTLHYYYIFEHYFRNDNQPLLNCFPSKMFTYPIGFLMRKGFPFTQKINKIIRYLIESGFLLKWKMDISQFNRNFKNSDNNFGHMLTLHNLKPVFYLMMIFYGACCVVFILEHVFNKLKKRNLKTS